MLCALCVVGDENVVLHAFKHNELTLIKMQRLLLVKTTCNSCIIFRIQRIKTVFSALKRYSAH